LQGFFAAQGLHGLHGFFAAQGLQGLQAFALQGLQAPQAFLVLQGLQAAIWIDVSGAFAIAVGRATALVARVATLSATTVFLIIDASKRSKPDETVNSAPGPAGSHAILLERPKGPSHCIMILRPGKLDSRSPNSVQISVKAGSRRSAAMRAYPRRKSRRTSHLVRAENSFSA